MHTFYQLGKKYVFPPFFIPFQSFFFPNLLFGHIFAPRGWVKQKNIHPCLVDDVREGAQHVSEALGTILNRFPFKN